MSTILTEPRSARADQCVVLRGITWNQYTAIRETLGDRSDPRLIYCDGRMTLLSPSYEHDFDEKIFGYLVATIADGLGIAWSPAGHTTYRAERKGAGVEGDETFYFGEHAVAMVGVKKIDTDRHRPPDLVIEVEATHPANDALIAWGRLGAPEVWRLDVERGTLVFGSRQDDGSYAPSETSQALFPLKPSDVLDQLRLLDQHVASRWRKNLEEWVRTVLLPRRGEHPPEKG